MLLFVSLWAIISAITSASFSTMAALAAVDVAIVSVFVLIEGAKFGRFRQVLVSIPAYYVLRPINIYVFWRSMWREWVRRDVLRVWEKGH